MTAYSPINSIRSMSREALDAMEPAKAIAFTDKQGNRFIFPSWIIRRDDPDAPLATDHWWEAHAICSRTDLSHEWYEFDAANFPHVQSEIGSGIFFHGRATTYLFAGPVFDEVKAEAGAA